MPQKLNITGTNTSGTIMQSVNYLYAANGQKLRKQTRIDHQLAATYDYAGRFVYSDLMGDDTQLSYLMANQGRIILHEDGSFGYEYAIKDHLGNTRVTFDEKGKILQEDTYYPFGMNISGLSYNQNTIQNKYKYNGKELQDEFGLDCYDYGARMYDAEIGRFQAFDPLSENNSFQSPFAYAANNPIKFIDRNGENPILIIGGIVFTAADVLLISTGVYVSGVILYKAQDGSLAINGNIIDYFARTKRKPAQVNYGNQQKLNRPKKQVQKNNNKNPYGTIGVLVATFSFKVLELAINLKLPEIEPYDGLPDSNELQNYENEDSEDEDSEDDETEVELMPIEDMTPEEITAEFERLWKEYYKNNLKGANDAIEDHYRSGSQY